MFHVFIYVVYIDFYFILLIPYHCEANPRTQASKTEYLFRALGLHCSPVGGLVQPYDGLEPGNRLRRLGLWGTIYAGTFPLGLVLVQMGDLLKYIQYIFLKPKQL